MPLFIQQNAINEKLGNKENLAIGLMNVAQMAQLSIGALRDAEANLHRSIALCREIEDDYNEALGQVGLGRLLAYRGAFTESETELATAMKIDAERKYVQPLGLVWAYLAVRELLRLRGESTNASRQPILAMASRALELADVSARIVFPVELDYVRAHWLLGAAHRVAGQPGEAERHLHEALERCRRINMVDYEADILIELARLCTAAGASADARRWAEEALLITERSGYVLQGADAHLELAKLAIANGDNAAAKEHAQQAKDLATCDGPPDYTYKAAYDEAGGYWSSWIGNGKWA